LSKIIDAIGMVFGKLTVIEKVPTPEGKRGGYWLCQCSCNNSNNQKIVSWGHLCAGSVRSCGCLKYEDLTGQKFGKLTAIKRVPAPEGEDRVFWLCRCDCNGENCEKVVKAINLKMGYTRSCGCIFLGGTRFIDLVGQRFGKLVVIERAAKVKGREVYWLCQCDCKGENSKRVASGYQLRTGRVHSCGCTKAELIGLSNKKEYGESALNSLFSEYKDRARKKGFEFELTKEDFKKLIFQNCSYCGAEPHSIKKNAHNNGDCVYNGIDRMNNKLGYIMSNVVTACEDCNKGKRMMTKDEFLQWIKRIYNYSILNKGID
jgi:hypothetical protein